MQDHLFSLLVFGFLVYLLRGERAAALAFAAAATLAKYQAVFFVLAGAGGLALFFPGRRRDALSLLKGYALVLLALVVSVAALGLATGDLATHGKAIAIEQLARFDFFGVLPRLFPGLVVKVPWDHLAMASHFCLIAMVGTACMLPLVLLFRGGPEERLFCFVGSIYLVAVLASNPPFPRYFIPLVPLVASVAALRLAAWTRSSDDGPPCPA
jgi:hypothetical protein